MLQSPFYTRKKTKKIETAIKRKLESISSQPISSETDMDANITESENFQQLQEKFNEVTI